MNKNVDVTINISQKKTNARLKTLPASQDSQLIQSNEPNQIRELQLLNEQLLCTNREIQKKLNYYEDVFNNQPVGMYRIRVFPLNKWENDAWIDSASSPYTLELVSDCCCDMLGVSRQDFIANPYIISDLIYTDDKKSFSEANRIANKKCRTFIWEGRLLIDNKTVWVRLESQPRKLTNGEILWTGVIHNISRQKEAEEAENKSRLKLENVLIGAKVGTLEWNVQTGEMNFNDVLAHNLGYTVAGLKMLAKKKGADLWKEFTHPDDIPLAGEAIMRHFTGELPYHSVEVRMKHKKGHWIWVRQEGKLMSRTPEGMPLLMFGTHTDISTRKEMEENLRQNEEKYRILFEDNPQPMLIADPLNLRILEGNKSFIRHYGYSRKELLSMSINDLHLVADEEDLQLTIEKLKNGETETGVKRHRKKNGEIIFVEIKIHRIEYNGGVATHALINDVTRRVLAENALYEANSKLEERIAERTSELLKLNASLRESEQKFKTANDFTTDWEYWRSPDNRIIFMSPSVKNITGYSIAEFENDPALLDKIVYQGDKEVWNNHKQERSVHSPYGNPIEIVFRIVKKNGEVRWIGHVCRYICINGEHLGVRVSNRDITEKINAEKAMLGVTVEVEERERNRLSRELHDGLGPLLSTIKLYFEWLSETDNADKKKLIAEKGNKSIEAAIQTARELSHGLNSNLLLSSGYIPAILDFIGQINDSSRISIKFSSNTKKQFNKYTETTLYRISTELIKNTLTYAKASVAGIDFRFDKTKNLIYFIYTDDGIGFDTTTILRSGKGLGLMNIQQRVKILRGNIQFESSPGNGVKICIQLPVEPGKSKQTMHEITLKE